jgi:glutamyl/glutaminyl-tRNA synthetase
MVDDHIMEITHVIRGEEWISSAPKHVLLYRAFGWTPPTWVHVPVINGKDGKKLSKRHGDTRCLDYKASGYLPESLANFIALIGWAPGGDRELMTMDEMGEAFDISGLQPSPGVFDKDKLDWMNGHYIRSKSSSVLATEVLAYAAEPLTTEYWSQQVDESGVLDPTGPALATLAAGAERNPALYQRAIELEQERVTTLAGFGPACEFFLVDEPAYDQAAVQKWFGQAHVRDLLTRTSAWLTSLGADPAEAEIEAFLRGLGQELGFEKLGPIVHPMRVAMTGKTVGPGLWELMAALGRETMIKRLDRALGQI